ncbi:MAG: helix-turn-helix transcriptional regulator [Cyanobium sp. M30B3]|nr:MAG: helix-turn-helix transcriptional regulator [Cyanobium sp. M30B3]
MADGRPGRLRPGLTHLEHRVLADAAEAFAAMAPMVPLLQFRPLVAEREFYQEIGLLQINRLRLMSYASAPVQLILEPTASVHLAVGFSGCRFARTPEWVLANRAGCGLLLPSGPIDVSGGSSSAVVTLQPADLARAVAAMAGNADAHASSSATAEQFRHFQARELSGLQARQLHALMQHLDACLGCHPALPARLGLDDVLLRMVVSWLQPQLLEETAVDRGRIHGRAAGSSFDELIDYIRANLDEPLRLSDLEARSHYSKRALQYAFRQRLDCTPRQWIRGQRLEQALAQLEQGGRSCSIRAIALACGYRHMGLFSSDFRKRFGLTPSAARRASGGGTVLVQVCDMAVSRGQPSPPPTAQRPAPPQPWRR